MKLLMDTNILLRLQDAGHALHDRAQAAVDRLDSDGHEGVIVPQVLYEYWVVATRPAAVNGLGMDLASVEASLSKWLSVFRLLRDERGIFGFWRELVTNHQVQGKNAHDARLVAAMQRHGLVNLLTFNGPDFVRFAGINVYSPSDVVAGQLPE